MTPYADIVGADNYFQARGQSDEWSAVPDQDAALVRGSDYIDQRYRRQIDGRWLSMFSGHKTGGRSQYREWPRDGAFDYYNDDIPDGDIPDEVKFATFEAAIREGTNPGSLLPDYVPAEGVKQEKVGPISVTYKDGNDPDGNAGMPRVTEIDRIIAPLLTGPGASIYGEPRVGVRLV